MFSTFFKTRWNSSQFALFYVVSLLESGLRGSQSFQKEFCLSVKTNKIKLMFLVPLFNAFLYNSPICRLQPRANKVISPTFYDFLHIMFSFLILWKTTLIMMHLVYLPQCTESKNGRKNRSLSSKALSERSQLIWWLLIFPRDPTALHSLSSSCLLLNTRICFTHFSHSTPWLCDFFLFQERLTLATFR